MDLWTTKDGIESWWARGGSVNVRSLDLRPGGELHHAMTAVDPAQVAFMQQAGMPVTPECRIMFVDVQPLRRLEYLHLADFIPGVNPSDVTHIVQLHSAPGGVRMVLTFDAMHADEWTQRATMGWESELGKLGVALQQLAERRS